MAGDTPALDALLGVVALLNEHYDAIDADFQRFYGLDLGEACWGENHVGVRRLLALISGLPPESSLARSMGWYWDQEHELLASLLEVTHDVAHSTRVTGMAMAGKKFPKPEPFRFPRPGDEDPEEKPRPVSREDVRKTLLR